MSAGLEHALDTSAEYAAVGVFALDGESLRRTVERGPSIVIAAIHTPVEPGCEVWRTSEEMRPLVRIRAITDVVEPVDTAAVVLDVVDGLPDSSIGPGALLAVLRLRQDRVRFVTSNTRLAGSRRWAGARGGRPALPSRSRPPVYARLASARPVLCRRQRALDDPRTAAHRGRGRRSSPGRTARSGRTGSSRPKRACRVRERSVTSDAVCPRSDDGGSWSWTANGAPKKVGVAVGGDGTARPLRLGRGRADRGLGRANRACGDAASHRPRRAMLCQTNVRQKAVSCSIASSPARSVHGGFWSAAGHSPPPASVAAVRSR